MISIAPLFSLLHKLIYTFFGVFGIGFIIAFHELGHFLFGKLFNVKIPSFSIGFGPHLYSKKIGDTLFSLSAIPLGGYVELIDSPEQLTQEDGKTLSVQGDFFSQKPFYQQLCVMFGGILFNFIFAYIVFVGLFVTGLPKVAALYPFNVQPTIVEIAPGSAAEKARLNKGDTILAINKKSIQNSMLTLLDELRPLAHKEAMITVKRGQETLVMPILLDERPFFDATTGSLGASFTAIEGIRYPLGTSLQMAYTALRHYTLMVANTFYQLFSKRETKNIGGPLMLFSATIEGAKQGIDILLLFLAIISINLAFLNLLPFPPLDGGRIFIHVIEAIIQRPIADHIKNIIFTICLGSLLLLTLYFTIQDITPIIIHYGTLLKNFFGL